MKEKIWFFVKLLIMPVLLIVFILGPLMPQYLYSFNAALIDKVERLTSLEGPKLVLIGNSNLAFGVDSETLEAHFGLPVVNMGLQGGLGNAFHEEMAKLNVCEGDIYIVSHTSYKDSDIIGDAPLAWMTLETHPELWRLIRPKDMWSMIEGFPVYFQKALKLWINNAGNKSYPTYSYDRMVFNEYGDNAFPREETKGNIDFSGQGVPPINDTCTDRLNELYAYLTERGAHMAVAAICIPDGEYTPSDEAWITFQETLEEKLDCPVISDFLDYKLDYSYFFDTMYHLIDAGTAIRTELFIADIERWIAGDPAVGAAMDR